MDDCPCVAEHSPKPANRSRHHIVPLSWGGPDVAANIIVLCPTAHENAHTLLNEYVRHRGTPPWAVRQHYSPFTRALAVQAWAARPSDKPPWTLAHS